jgi:hypothetical protein
VAWLASGGARPHGDLAGEAAGEWWGAPVRVVRCWLRFARKQIEWQRRGGGGAWERGGKATR